jgi:hypothetical protein
VFAAFANVLLDLQANLPETSQFLSAQMAVQSSFFQVSIVLGMYNFVHRFKPEERGCYSEEELTFKYLPKSLYRQGYLTSFIKETKSLTQSLVLLLSKLDMKELDHVDQVQCKLVPFCVPKKIES